MTDPYTIAFLVVPLVLAALGWAYELLAERAEDRRTHAAE
jgi:cytochrome bd-type quinol oxidase subunit 2